MDKQINRKWFFNHSSEKVWEFLTQAEHIEKWLMPNDFKLELGHQFTFTTNPIPDLGLSGTFYCEVLEIDPLKKLVYSWQGGMTKENPTLFTSVQWTLESKDGGTELSLVHTGFKEANEIIRGAMYEGWDQHIQKMITNLNPA